jgi:hypothetical protein
MTSFGNKPGDPGWEERWVAGQDAATAGADTDRTLAHGSPHGKPSSWVLIGLVIAAFIIGGVAIITHLWWLFWACVAVIVLAIPSGKMIRIMDDTVSWETSAPLAESSPKSPNEDY